MFPIKIHFQSLYLGSEGRFEQDLGLDLFYMLVSSHLSPQYVHVSTGNAAVGSKGMAPVSATSAGGE